MKIFLLLLLTCSEICSQDWDHIIFAQHWPATLCLDWVETNSSRTCASQEDPVWKIHGLWPTKTGSKGPTFCKHAPPFDEAALQPILPELEQNWTNIDTSSQPDSFWKYEWKKHGSCAASLPDLDQEIKYFSKGLEWVRTYSMHQALSSNGVSEGPSPYTSDGIFKAVKNAFGKIPTLHCYIDTAKKQFYLLEIRLCFDKNLTLIDCPDNAGSHFLANCPQTGDLFYPIAAKPPPPPPSLEHPKLSSKWLFTVFKTLRFLQWFTR